MGALRSTYFNTSRYEEVAIYKWDNPYISSTIRQFFKTWHEKA